MIVICLEGCHGSGKTQLCKQFSAVGFDVLDEAFLDAPSYAVHPQSLTMETLWVANWFHRLLKKHHELEAVGSSANKVFIADRSPYSAVFYSKKGGQYLTPLIDTQVAELREAGIEIYTVHVKVAREILWSRICQRLEREPERKKYNEDKEEWMDTTLAFYSSQRWDFTVENNAVSITTVMRRLIDCLRRDVPSFKHTVVAENLSFSPLRVAPVSV